MSPAPKTLTLPECHALIEALLFKDGTDKQQSHGIRNATMGLCMLDAGLRVGEVCRLRKSDLWFNSEPVTSIIVGTGIAEKGSERQVPITQRLSEALKVMNYYWWSELQDVPAGPAFYGRYPRQSLTTRQVQRIIATAAHKALGRSIHPQILRHTFASRLMRKTNTRNVQVLLGHKNLSSTQIYTHPNQQDLVEAIQTLDPGPLSNRPGSQ
ncbi:Tyrosine recombinase XerC [subsurface metagenome]